MLKIGFLLKKIVSIFATQESKHLKIDSIAEDKHKGLLYVVVRINGKCMPPIKKMPYELLLENGPKISSLFSNLDFHLLVNALLENQKRTISKQYIKIYSLIKHQFSETNGEPLLVFQNLITSEYHIKPAKEVFSDLLLINNFDSKDAACIGNIVGSFETEKEISFCKSKLSNIIKFDNSSSALITL